MKHLHQYPDHPSHTSVQMLHPYGICHHPTEDFMDGGRSHIRLPWGCWDEAFAPIPRPPVSHFGTNASSLRDVSIFNALRANKEGKRKKSKGLKSQRIKGYKVQGEVQTIRKPLRLSRLPSVSRVRPADRQIPGPLYQQPPRRTR